MEERGGQGDEEHCRRGSTGDEEAQETREQAGAVEADSTADKCVRTLGFLQVFLPNIMLFVAFVFWGVTEGFPYETISCCALYILRPVMVIYVAPYLKKMPDHSLLTEFVIFELFYFSVLFSLAWGYSVYYRASEKIMIIGGFGVVILFCIISIISILTDMKTRCHGEICKWIWTKLTFVAGIIFYILPSLQFILLSFTFGATEEGFFVTMIFPLFFILSFACVRDINKEKSCRNLLSVTSWMISMFILTALMMCFYITTLEKEKDAAGWTSTAAFVQVLWMVAVYIKALKEDLDLSLTFKKILYVFGSVGVVLLTSVALMTELILKSFNGKREVGDMRVVVFSSESLFAFSLLILSMFGPWISDMKCWQCCQKEVRTEDVSHRIEPEPGLTECSRV